MLEVLDREPGALVPVSGYGPSSQWFRNVSTDPSVRVCNGRVRAAEATAEILPAAEARDRLAAYRRSHPKAAASLGKVLGIEDLTNPAPLRPDIADRLPLVRIKRGS